MTRMRLTSQSTMCQLMQILCIMELERHSFHVLLLIPVHVSCIKIARASLSISYNAGLISPEWVGYVCLPDVSSTFAILSRTKNKVKNPLSLRHNMLGCKTMSDRSLSSTLKPSSLVKVPRREADRNLG